MIFVSSFRNNGHDHNHNNKNWQTKRNNLWFETKLARADSKSLNKNISTQENKNIKKTHVTYPYIFQHPHSHNLCWIAVEFFVFSALLLTARWRRDRETQCMTARRGIYQ